MRQTYNDLEAERRAALAAELDTTEAAAPAQTSAADLDLIEVLPYLRLNLAEAPEPLLRGCSNPPT